jgi:hypothetical protein
MNVVSTNKKPNLRASLDIANFKSSHQLVVKVKFFKSFCNYITIVVAKMNDETKRFGDLLVEVLDTKFNCLKDLLSHVLLARIHSNGSTSTKMFDMIFK